MMGGATFAIGLLPTYAQAGPLAPMLLILMRIIQGTALGGEYGGAAIYVAEHAPADRRGAYTSWVQSSAAFGLVGALGAILLARTMMGEARFSDGGSTGGWRIPFLLSAALLAISIWIRLKLTESPGLRGAQGPGRPVPRPLCRGLRPVEESEGRSHRPGGDHVRPGRRLVHALLLRRAGLSRALPQGRAGHGNPASHRHHHRRASRSMSSSAGCPTRSAASG